MASNLQKTNIWIDGTQAGSTLTELKKSVNALNREIKDLPRNSDAYNAKVKELSQANAALADHRNKIKGVSGSYGEAKSSIGSLIGQFTPLAGGIAIATGVISGISTAISSWYNNNKEMEKSLSSLQSLTGASTEDLKFYKSEAIELGKTTTLSASQAVEAFKLIGSARPDLLANKEALAQVTKEAVVLSEAAEMDLGAAAQSLAGSMNQFNLGAEHSARIINALAAGSKEGAAEITDVSASIEKFGTVAAANNVTFEESVALTELMAEKNIKNAEAGTQLRNVLLNVATASALPQEAQKAMAQYGVNIELVMNKAIPLKDRLTELSKVQKDQTALVKIFGKENVVAGQTILENVDKFDKLTKAVTGTNTAYKQQEINNDNLDGDLKKLGSAWEGLTLSMGGASGVFRGVVQNGTDVLNWTSDLITAFREADTLKIETQFLKLADAMTFGIGPLHDYIGTMIQINEITSQVLDTVKSEVEANVLLTDSLAENNEILKQKNLTAEERNELEQENEKIITVLNEKYPELTKNIDLQKLSTKELNKLQKEMNKTLVEQTLAQVQATEVQRLYGIIVEETMKREIALEAVRRGSKGNILEKVFSGFDAWDAVESQEKINDATKQLKNLGSVIEQVKGTLMNIDLTSASASRINKDIIANARMELASLEKQIKIVKDIGSKQSLEAQIKGLRQVISQAEKGNQEALDKLINKNAEMVASDDKTTATIVSNKAKQTAASKKSADDMSKMLEKLIQDTDKLANDFNNQLLSSLMDGQEREIENARQAIEKKYEDEIQAAIKLSQQKGEIGLKANQQLQRLLIMQEEEFQAEKKKIDDKYKSQEYEAEKQQNLKLLAQQESYEKAKVDLKVEKAKFALQAVRDGDLQGYRQAKTDLENALREQAEFEKRKKLEALLDQYDQEIINKEEFQLRKEQLEIEHQERIKNINIDASQELKKIDEQRLADGLQAFQDFANVAKQYSDAYYQGQINKIDDRYKKEKSSLDAALKAKTISEEEYNKKKEELDKEAALKKYELELKQFKANQAAAVVNAMLNTALAVTKITAQTGIGALFAVPLALLSLGAQLTAIKNTPAPEAPQFKDGGYTDVIGQQDGLRYRAKRIGKIRPGMTPGRPSLALVGEEGPEYVVSAQLLRKRPVANAVAMIEAMRVSQFKDGGFTANGMIGVGNDELLLQALKANTAASYALIRNSQNMNVVFSDKNIEDLEENQSRLKSVKK